MKKNMSEKRKIRLITMYYGLLIWFVENRNIIFYKGEKRKLTKSELKDFDSYTKNILLCEEKISTLSKNKDMKIEIVFNIKGASIHDRTTKKTN